MSPRALTATSATLDSLTGAACSGGAPCKWGQANHVKPLLQALHRLNSLFHITGHPLPCNPVRHDMNVSAVCGRGRGESPVAVGILQLVAAALLGPALHYHLCQQRHGHAQDRTRPQLANLYKLQTRGGDFEGTAFAFLAGSLGS